MTMWDFLYKAGFWQWCGFLFAVAMLAGAIINLGPFVIRATNNTIKPKD